MEKQEWEKLGEEFAKQYYIMFDTQPRETLLALYHPTAMFTFEENRGFGHENIKEILTTKLQFSKIQHIVTKIDCQPSADNGVLVLVTGQLKTDDDPPLGFSQVFLLKPDSNSYFIFHDIFRLSIHNV